MTREETPDDVVVTHSAYEDLRERAEAWMAEHPGYDEHNFMDLWRDEDGELHDESDEFVDAYVTFHRWTKAKRMLGIS